MVGVGYADVGHGLPIKLMGCPTLNYKLAVLLRPLSSVINIAGHIQIIIILLIRLINLTIEICDRRGTASM